MKLGYYKYETSTGVYPDKVYTPHTLRVDIIGETEKMYEVKYLEFHANGAPPGYTTRVRKYKVKVAGEPVVNKGTANGREWLAPDSEDIRKPYKDD